MPWTGRQCLMEAPRIVKGPQQREHSGVWGGHSREGSYYSHRSSPHAFLSMREISQYKLEAQHSDSQAGGSERD